MDNFRISSLISQRRVVKLTDVDPNETYVQLGVHQQGNRQLSPSSAGAYPSYAMPLSELTKPSGPLVFRALLTDDPAGGNPIVTLLEDTLSEGAGYTISVVSTYTSKCYELKFTNGVLTPNKTALPSSGNFAGLINSDLSGNILEAPEVIYNYVDAFTVGFCAFNLGQAPGTGYLNNHYLEVLVFP